MAWAICGSRPYWSPITAPMRATAGCGSMALSATSSSDLREVTHVQQSSFQGQARLVQAARVRPIHHRNGGESWQEAYWPAAASPRVRAPRPSLTATLARLAEQKRRARERFRVVAGDWPNPTEALRQVDAWRADCEAEIREQKAVLARLLARREGRRKAG
jgi:hypothetical protein